MDIKTLTSTIRFLPADISVLVRGPHGIGKSQVAAQLAADEGKTLIDRRLSQMSEGDMVGLPELVDGVTRFCPPDWYARACKEPTVLLLDELNRATPEVMQAAFQIVLDRELNGHRLHEGTRVVACINASAEYEVNEMDPALLDRFWVCDLEPSDEDWLTWAAANGVIQGVKSKGQYQPTYLGNTLMGKSSASDSVLAAGAALYASDLSNLGGGKATKQLPPSPETEKSRPRGGSGAWDSGPDSPVHQPTLKQYESGDEECDWEDLLDDDQ